MTNEQALAEKAAEIEASLSHFHGSETFYRHWTGRLIYTEGLKYLADATECYWLLDAIASHQPTCRKDMMLATSRFGTCSLKARMLFPGFWLREMVQS